MRVRFLYDKDWAWVAGQEAVVVKLSAECKTRLGSQYQMFWTQPDSKTAIWWTMPDDVELVNS